MSNTWLIFFGAGIGGVLRYWISHGAYWLLGRQFPYGTLLVNVSGSFLMGLLFVLIMDKLAFWVDIRPFPLFPLRHSIFLKAELGFLQV